LLAVASLSVQFATDSGGQSFPAKTVRYLVHDAAGSGSDTIGRIVAAGLAQALGQQVIVDNRAGAGGNIGAEIAAKAPADGYTLFQTSSALASAVSLYRKLSYNLVRDFASVTLLASSPSIVVVHPSLPVTSIGDLVKLAKAKPGAINYGSAGVGSSTFVAAELFKNLAGVNLLHVPYKGGGPALVGVVTGETSVYFAPLAASLAFIQRGRLRALAVTTASRLPLLPDYPTVAEAGIPGYQTGNWYALLVPAKTAKEIVATIHRAAVSALKNPNVSKRLGDLGYVSIGNQPDECAVFIKSEIEKLAKLFHGLGLTAN